MLLFLKDFNAITTKYETAEAYLKQGFSLIPVTSNKRSAVKWKPFQQQQPTLTQLQQWFSDDSQLGIGIVTGRISQLAVLDFDTHKLFRKFIQQHPELIETYTVKTKRGWHLYFRILEYIYTRSLKGQGIDWQFDGHYVAAPPTPGYEIAANLPLLTLTQEDINAIEAFVQPKREQVTISDLQTQHITKEELIGYYTKNGHVGQRNDTLFKTGMLARDYGWTLKETIKLLSSYHAHNRYQHESIEQRQREAVATLNSVFSRPPRPVQSSSLPNIIKETLFQIGQTAAVRVIEALRLLGYQPGDWVCRKTVIKVLKDIVGEWSIVKALTVIVGENQPLFRVIKGHLPPRTPNEPLGSAVHTPKGTISKCNEIRVSKPHFSQKGRKTHFYQMPSNAELAGRLGVPLSRITDKLNLEDIRSAKKTRQTMHYRYIQRRPGKYARKWLAKRLGVSICTKNRYDNEIENLYKMATYTEIRIYGRNLNAIPEDNLNVPGVFLEDDTGKRWPAKQVIAAKLLKQGRRVTLKKQNYNFYWCGNRFDYDSEQIYFTPPKPRQVAHDLQNVLQSENRIAAYWSAVYDNAPDTQKPQNLPISADLQDSQSNHNSESRKQFKEPLSNTRYHQDRPHNPKREFRDEYLESKAKSLQKQINRLAKSPDQQISLRSVRKLIVEYGHQEIAKVIKRIKWRSNVNNFVGLLTVILKSEKRVRELQQLTG